MKILIGTYDIAGWVQQYKKGFEALGHSVKTAVFRNPDTFYAHNFDVTLDEWYNKGRDSRKLESGQYFDRLVRKIRNKTADNLYRQKIYHLIDEHDLVIVLWSPFIDDFTDYEYVKRKGKKLICLFVGSDVRYFQSFVQEFNVKHWSFPENWIHYDPSYHLRIIRQAEKHSDLIYSVRDQAGLQLKPYYHIHVPISTEGFQANIPGNKKIKVVHAPSIPFKKGTDIIERTLSMLQNEGVDLEIISVRNMHNSEVLKLLREADVLVDELVYHGPGSLSFEAMLSGCAVATRFIEDAPPGFRPPVWQIDAENIYDKLKLLLSDSALIRKLAESGKDYAMKSNESVIIAHGMLQDLETFREFDYYPRFLRDSYLPHNQNEIDVINYWTDFVKDCTWYKQYVKAGSREGLVF